MSAGGLRILFTGGGGYLGGHLTPRLKAAGHDVVRFGIGPGHDREGDLLSPEDAEAAYRETAPDLVFHAAALIQGRGVFDDDLYAGNMAMIDNLLAAGARRFVFVSSMTVYPPTPTLPVQEDAAAATSAYGRSKLDGERRLADRADLAVSVRLPGLFGAPRAGGLIHALLAHCADDAPLRLPDAPVLWAAMDVADAAQAIAQVIDDLPTQSTTLNVGYPDVFSINRLVDAAAALFGRAIAYDVAHPDFQMDLTRLQAVAGQPSRSFSDALIAYAARFRAPPSQGSASPA